MVRVPVDVHALAHDGVDVEDHLAEVDGRHPVDQDLVGLRQDREPAALDALDEVHLPQRTVPVEPARQDPAGQVPQLVDRPRPRQRGASYVVGQVEVLVVGPHRVGQPSRDRAQPLAVARHERDAVADQRDEPVVVEARRRRLEDLEGRVVHRRARGLRDQEGHVVRPEPFTHRDPSQDVVGASCDSGRTPAAIGLRPSQSRRTDGLRPRHRWGEGPPDPCRVRHGRSRRRPRGLLHRARAGVAHAAVRRGDEGHPGPGLARLRRRQRVVPGAAAGARPRVLRVRRVGGRGGTGPAAQPHVRRGLRAAVGRRSCRRPCCSARSTGRSARCARSTSWSRGSPAATRDGAC